MPPKAKIQQPIDKPLSRAYLREFSGWSTAYPPGLSDPSSLRIMENLLVNKDGSIRVRPGLRYLSFDEAPVGEDLGTAYDQEFIGTHEVFFLNDGTKAYLFAVREDDDTVGFRVLVFNSTSPTVYELDEVGVDFSIPQGAAALNFSSETTYVKYLQIDNKIFALSNAGEPMRLFFVGESKIAKRLLSIDKPDWTLADKLTIVQPDAATWINAVTVSATRYNMVPNPSFEAAQSYWNADSSTELTALNSTPKVGSYKGSITSKPTRSNLAKRPLHDVAGLGVSGWSAYNAATAAPSAVGSYLRVANAGAPAVPYELWVQSLNYADVVAGQSYKLALNFEAPSAGVSNHRVHIIWVNSIGGVVGHSDFSPAAAAGVWVSGTVTAPSGAVGMHLYVGALVAAAGAQNAGFKEVMLCKSTESTTFFDGSDGSDYYWSGTTNDSASVHHPPVDVEVWCDKQPVPTTGDVSVLVSKRLSAAGPIDGSVGVRFYDSTGAVISTDMQTPSATTNAGWTDIDHTDSIPALATHAALVIQFEDLPRGVSAYVDGALMELAASAGTYFDGDTADSSTVINSWAGVAHASNSVEQTYATGVSVPAAETATANTLISSTAASNDVNVAMFYAFENEVGESAYSQVTQIKVQRLWSEWKWQTASAAGEPSGTATDNPALCADQLVAAIPQAVFDQALAAGATSWSLYMATWSDQTVAPVEAAKIAERPLTSASTRARDGWARMTPEQANYDETAPIPSASTRYNYSNPSNAAQGLVAADRMVMVLDREAPAVIRWSSNNQGEYTNFSASLGGGYKTLTSGNLYTPAAVKLWQNPQSVDTLTILCMGVDGHSTGYYMAPAEVTSQSDATPIMGFEETTATQGTTSPYGCEVFNNALYHPLDDQIMKSTASNYNINHKSITEMIIDDWQGLLNKARIVSSEWEKRLHYIVHNPNGEELEAGCRGNEIWVYDAEAKEGNWSRYLIQASSLRKIEYGGRVYMSVIRPDGIFYLDPESNFDDIVEDDLSISRRYIPWRLETNIQGANRAHDAWCHLRQVYLHSGNFQGSMRWGIRSMDVNGKHFTKQKTFRDLNGPDLSTPVLERLLPFDLKDILQVNRNAQEWYFFASNLEDEDGNVLPSFGQISAVEYRYLPVSVNVGYEYGSVETFEYSRATVNWAQRTTDGGVPTPFLDTGRP